ncbi:MAG: hypothetical protein ACREJ3_20195 [Polyangiaceae bacterium]
MPKSQNRTGEFLSSTSIPHRGSASSISAKTHPRATLTRRPKPRMLDTGPERDDLAEALDEEAGDAT